MVGLTSSRRTYPNQIIAIATELIDLVASDIRTLQTQTDLVDEFGRI
jgi:hypothetical protein